MNVVIELLVDRAHRVCGAAGFGLLLLIAGCSGSGGAEESTAANTASDKPASSTNDDAGTSEDSAETVAPVVIAPLSLDDASRSTTAADAASDDDDEQDSLLEAMEPLKVLTGTWRATPRTARAGDKLEEPSWAWDFQTDPGKPALVMSTNDSPYFRSIRLGYDVETHEFTMTVDCIDDQVRELRGAFENPPMEFQGDDRRTHIAYKLTLSEIDPADERDQWQVAFNQQDNNRYMVELSRWRNSSEQYDRFETINTQRQGTSFAQADDDYGDRECIISGGLGTMQVSYEGKSYWVCCSGCQAAFNDDPAKWIARFEEKQREEMEE